MKIPESLEEKIEILLFQYQEQIYRTWERITHEIHTPPLMSANWPIEKLRKQYPKVRITILKQTAKQRKEYIKQERDKIITEELSNLYTELNKIRETNLLKLMDLTRLLTWDWDNRKDNIQECIRDKLQY